MKSKTKAKINGQIKRLRIFIKLFNKKGETIVDTSRMIKSKIDALIERESAAETGYIKVCYSPDLWNDGTYTIEQLKQVLIDWTSKDMIETALKEF